MRGGQIIELRCKYASLSKSNLLHFSSQCLAAQANFVGVGESGHPVANERMKEVRLISENQPP